MSSTLPILFTLGIYAWWQAYRFCIAYGEPIYGIFVLKSSGLAGSPSVEVSMYPQGQTVDEMLNWVPAPGVTSTRDSLHNPKYPFAESRPISTNLAWLFPVKRQINNRLVNKGRMIRDPNTNEILLIEPLYRTKKDILWLFWGLYAIGPALFGLYCLGVLLLGLPSAI